MVYMGRSCRYREINNEFFVLSIYEFFHCSPTDDAPRKTDLRRIENRVDAEGDRDRVTAAGKSTRRQRAPEWYFYRRVSRLVSSMLSVGILTDASQ